MRSCVLFPQELSNGGVVFINAGRSGAERMSATAALKHRFMAQARPCPSFEVTLASCYWFVSVRQCMDLGGISLVQPMMLCPASCASHRLY